MLRKRSSRAAFDLDSSFWRDSNSWPHDHPGYVFIASAFREIGALTYGGACVQPPNINEPEEPEDPPDDCNEEIWDIHEQEYDRYERTCEEARAECEGMWATVARMISEACEIGALISGVRAKGGGKMKKLKPHYWNAEGVKSRFSRCEMSLNDPFSDRYRSKDAYWIFIARDSLRKYIGAQEKRATSVSTSSGEKNRVEGNKIKRRKPGTGSWKAADEPLLLEMRSMLEKGEAKSPHHAAGLVAHRTSGAGTVESKQSRLGREYRKKFPAGEK
jgi:hypothetical protein